MRCAAPNQLGTFASDALLKLGLLGTIVGFILMLAPIAGLDAADRASVKSSMGLIERRHGRSRCTPRSAA